MKSKCRSMCLLSAIALAASTASAALNVTTKQYSSEPNATGFNGYFPVSAGDLGVDAVRFTFLNTTLFGMLESNGVSVYREIDINGKPVYPKGTLISFR